jgi:hypothetical protein
MKKETTPKRKGLKRKTSDGKRVHHKMLEGEGGAFQFHLEREMLTAHRTKAIPQIKNQEPLAQ